MSSPNSAGGHILQHFTGTSNSGENCRGNAVLPGVFSVLQRVLHRSGRALLGNGPAGGHAFSCQMSSLYWAMVRSEENQPALAMLVSAFLLHARPSAMAESASALARQ